MARPKLENKTSATVIRVDEKLKKQAIEICDELGVTLSSVYIMLLKAIVRTRSIPFKLEISEATIKD